MSIPAIQRFDACPEQYNSGSVTMRQAMTSLGRAVATLVNTPEHEKLHQVVEAQAATETPQPLNPEPLVIVRKLQQDVLPQANGLQSQRGDVKRLTHFGSMLIQFSDYVPALHSTVDVSYAEVEELHAAVVERAGTKGPLDYSDQLNLALELEQGDVPEALWRLFIASRMYARWLDGKIMRDMPKVSTEEAVDVMLQWRRSIAACKDLKDCPAQDTGGDAYYVWTHALAKVMYSLSPVKTPLFNRAAISAFHRGTSVMHTLIHAINKQGVQSDHTTASVYGNAIGQVCVDRARQQEDLYA